MQKLLILFIVLAVSATSCIAPKRLKYIQQKEKALADTSFQKLDRPDYQVQVNDILSIQVRSADPATNELFNIQNMRQNGGQMVNDAILYLNGYSVDLYGDIEMPVLGKVHVVGLTLSEIKDLVQKQLSDYFTEVFVSVQLSGLKFAVVGEVTRPGKFVAYQNQLNIFEALAMAGDITFVGNRKTVEIMRQYPDGIKIFRIDLTDSQVVNSPYYFIQPNDVINVNPLPQKSFGIGTEGFTTLSNTLSILSSTILIINLLSN